MSTQLAVSAAVYPPFSALVGSLLLPPPLAAQRPVADAE